MVDVLVDATQEVMRKQPGFVSRTSIGASMVRGYQLRAVAQPRGVEAMLQNQEAAEHMGEAARIAERLEPHLYEVSSVDEVRTNRGI